MIGLASHDRSVRLHALGALGRGDDAAYAVRRLLLGDPDATVRATAAGWLGSVMMAAPWLIEALEDGSPLVRDEVIRALARIGDHRAWDPLVRRSHDEPVWWVRRSAVYALGVLGGPALIHVVRRVLADPFWRVRNAAVQVLTMVGAADPGARGEILAELPGDPGPREYLRVLWGPALINNEVRPQAASRLPEALRDPDPAVVTARLAHMDDVAPLALVELLCDPHQALRELAAARLAASGDLDALEAALAWLDEPRIPHVGATVQRLLDGAGDQAAAVATRVLSAPARPGASRWAVGWVAAVGADDPLVALARERAEGDVECRRALLPLATAEELAAALGDDELAADAARELEGRTPSRAAAVMTLVGEVTSPRARAAIVRWAAALGDHARVMTMVDDGDPRPRALALRVLLDAGRLDEARRARAAEDEDPIVRGAVVDGAHAAEALMDPDPWVAREAMQRLSRDRIEQRELVVRRALASDDPWIRARGCELLALGDEDELALLGEALADREPMVRAAAEDRLGPGIEAGLQALLAGDTISAAARRSVHAWLIRGLDEPARRHAEAALAGDEPAAARALLEAAVAAITGTRVEAVAEPRRLHIPAPRPPADVERRTLGATGIVVPPLAVSGAFELGVPSLAAAAEAGVELYFWEPTYANLSYFLRERRRRIRSTVIAGTYHADAASITADVERGLRRLRRDVLDVFLLFWTRSPARLDDEAFAALEALKVAGKIRAIGFSTHDRGLASDAIQARPWDVVMIRHSAAHPGIEAGFLPAARARGTGVITFSALCYGRMLTGDGAPSAADCYRYSLAQPGVAACISAPRRHRELIENLDVLAAPALDEARQAAMRAHGVGVRAENQRFNTLLRQPTRAAAAAALELLERALPPDDEVITPPGDAAARKLERSRGSRGRRRATLRR